MLTGVRTKFHPNELLASTLSQWIGCARVIYNAKCDEERYLRTFAQKYLPAQTYAPFNQEYSQYKSELTPWLSECPSQILRNSATIWHRTYINFLKGVCKRPRRKSKVAGNYIWLTREVFQIKWDGATCVLTLGTLKRPVGTVRIKWNKTRIPKQPPASVWISKTHAGWRLSFSYDDGHIDQSSDNKDHLSYLSTLEEDQLLEMITPIDRGVAKPIQTDQQSFDLDAKAKSRLRYRERYIKRCQRKLARQHKGSGQRMRTIRSIAKLKERDVNLKNNFWHQTTHELAKSSKVIVMEDLNLKNMTKRAKPKQDEQGRWIKNGAKAKSGLNKALLNLGLNKFEVFITYKMAKLNKPVFKVWAYQTSQECAHCGYIHPSNRKTQADFVCQSCGCVDNADHNAALVIRKRAINLILNSGTELAGANKNVLRPRASANPRKTKKAQGLIACDCLSKKTVRL